MPIETFHTQIARNKRNSVILIAGFLAFFILFGLLIGAVWGGVRNAPAKAATSSSEVGVDVTGNSVGQPMVTTPAVAEVSFWDRINWPFSITIACLAGGIAFLLTLGTYFRGGNALLSISHASELKRAQDPQLFNVIEELSLAAGTPIPKVYIIQDSAMNAFATGRGPKHAAVAITTGLREKLTRDELQGVMAHELSHVRHYDILYATMMAVLVGMVVILADIFLRSVFWGAAGRRRSSSRDSGGGAIQIVLMIIAVILAILAQSNSWWAIWSIQTHEFESYREFMGLVVPSLMFVVIAFLPSPPIDSNRLFDLREYYFRRYGGLLHSSWFSFPVSSSFGPRWAMNNLPR